MHKSDELIRVFTGDNITALNLQAQLADEGIEAILQNDFQTGISAGILIAGPNTIDVFIQKIDFEQAKPVLMTFVA